MTSATEPAMRRLKALYGDAFHFVGVYVAEVHPNGAVVVAKPTAGAAVRGAGPESRLALADHPGAVEALPDGQVS